MRAILSRPSPVPPHRAPRAPRPSSEALRHQAVLDWAQHWHGAHAPAWASRDAFIVASATDPTLTVDMWLAVTEPKAAWIAVECTLPAGRVSYLAHRNWDNWWPIWRMVAPRLGGYPLAALAAWLDACVRKGVPVDPRPHLAAPHPPDPRPVTDTVRKRWGASASREPAAYVPRPAPRRGSASPHLAHWRPAPVIAVLLVGGLAVLAGALYAQQMAIRAHLALPAIAVAIGLLGTGMGLVHACTPLIVGEDPELRVRRLWPMGLAILTWIPLIRILG